MTPVKVVVDANIAFKILISANPEFRARLTPSTNAELFSPKFIIVEMFKHKDRIVRAAGHGEEEFSASLGTLVNRIEFVNEDLISVGTWMEARRLCQGIDPKDAPYVALPLHLEGPLWTEDTELKSGLAARGFNSFWP
jgi:predicted nucleic acid-binding protein